MQSRAHMKSTEADLGHECVQEENKMLKWPNETDGFTLGVAAESDRNSECTIENFNEPYCDN